MSAIGVYAPYLLSDKHFENSRLLLPQSPRLGKVVLKALQWCFRAETTSESKSPIAEYDRMPGKIRNPDSNWDGTSGKFFSLPNVS
jgi:hypothetical protein